MAALEADTARGRAILLRHMPPLIMTPEAKAYRITGAFDLTIALAEDGSLRPDGGQADGYAKRSVGGTGFEPATRRV